MIYYCIKQNINQLDIMSVTVNNLHNVIINLVSAIKKKFASNGKLSQLTNVTYEYRNTFCVLYNLIQTLKDRDSDAQFIFCAWYQGRIEDR